jgi:hypothetical protein
MVGGKNYLTTFNYLYKKTMEFNIRQGSTLPILKLRLVDDGKNDKSSFNDMLENSDIKLDMFDYKTGEPHLLNGQCQITTRKKKYNQTTDEYYIIYTFTEEDTSKIGKFEAKFTINFLDEQQNITSKLIVPIREKLFINIF